MWYPFSLTYGAILPSSLTRVDSYPLVFSTCLPVSVCGTVSIEIVRGFSWRVNFLPSLPYGCSPSQLGFGWTDFPIQPTSLLGPVNRYPVKVINSRYPFTYTLN